MDIGEWVGSADSPYLVPGSMKRTLLASERGFSLIRNLLIVVAALIFLIALYDVLLTRPILPPTAPVTPRILDFLDRVVDRITTLIQDLGRWLREVTDSTTGKIRDLLRTLWEVCPNLRERGRIPLEPIEGGENWAADMDARIDYAEKIGYNMDEVKALIERLKREGGFARGPGAACFGRPSPTPTPTAGGGARAWWQGYDWCLGPNWWRVESLYWEVLERQTLQAIRVCVPRARILGCSDPTPLVQRIEYIVENFNDHTLEGYEAAIQACRQLQEFPVDDSRDFTTELLTYLNRSGQYPSTPGSKDGDWFQKRMLEAIGRKTSGEREQSSPTRSEERSLDRSRRKALSYPQIIEEIDFQANLSGNFLQKAFADTVVAEIYLNYDLLRPAEDRYEQAIRALTKQVQAIPNNIDLNMALGLLHERVCKNNDLAIKAFKEVVALSRQAGQECAYASAHFHLGFLYLNIRPRLPVVETVTVFPTPVPPLPTPTPEPGTRSITREKPAQERRPERPTGHRRNVRPRERIRDSRGMIFGDFLGVSPDSAREFEEFLICQAPCDQIPVPGARPERSLIPDTRRELSPVPDTRRDPCVQAKNAQYFHQRYIEALRRQ